ncbi:hypothetical protein K458DRAFT_490906 [Lentithecium fluviatile CBS 122367]|uniref:Uncharacterized protein n=1 Tax=Lentithecium fluviatile CBS 122367 TaxID=1168545 RepID=A0A6G1ILH9_9PLEO|nr:hypothetical protein K458DRAFT_490906 [Lentithecium fluviatile CBS 122367]
MLGKFIGYLPPSDQYKAWQHWINTPRAPVEYGHCIDDRLYILQPTIKEAEEFEARILEYGRRQIQGDATLPDESIPYFAAILHQAQIISESTRDAFRSMYTDQMGPLYRYTNPSHSFAGAGQWLDSSQFHINPYFTNLFGCRLKIASGSIEVSLPPDTPFWKALVLKASLPPHSIYRLLETVFVTEPPCRCIGISTSGTELAGLQLLERLEAVDGVKIVQLLTVLRRQTPQLVNVWREAVNKMRNGLQTAPWIRYRLKDFKDQVFTAPPSPKFVFLRDNAQLEGA